jgi:hypothetical protein
VYWLLLALPVREVASVWWYKPELQEAQGGNIATGMTCGGWDASAESKKAVEIQPSRISLWYLLVCTSGFSIARR